MWGVWDVPATGILSAAKAAGRSDLVVATEDLGLDDAVPLAAKQNICCIGAQRPFDQGVTEAKLAAYGLLGQEGSPVRRPAGARRDARQRPEGLDDGVPRAAAEPAEEGVQDRSRLPRGRPAPRRHGPPAYPPPDDQSRHMPLSSRCAASRRPSAACRCLDDVDFELAAGEVHALLGGNGAGKSTLMKILEGVYSPDSGGIEVDGKQVRFTSGHDARREGIAMIFQEFSLIPTLTVAQNVFLDARAARRAGHAGRPRVRAARAAAVRRDRRRRRPARANGCVCRPPTGS